MNISELRDELADEVGVILGADFKIGVTKTASVPHASDGAITFPNLDDRTQGAKLIDTCVLYIDIRRSTDLNLAHKPQTVAKLYSAFVRSMTKCARQFGGHVRGIIGDRVMVLFDSENGFSNAVNCAILMNSTARYIINRHFKHGEIAFGIGIDAGRMLATKTGVRRNGVEQSSYRALVWLGRPANVASKLTDVANKPEETVTVPMVNAGHWLTGLYPFPKLIWKKVNPLDFVRNLRSTSSATLLHNDSTLKAIVVEDETLSLKPATPSILMTEQVWNGYRAANPDSNEVKNGWFREIRIKVPGYDSRIYGGDVIYSVFNSRS